MPAQSEGLGVLWLDQGCVRSQVPALSPRRVSGLWPLMAPSSIRSGLVCQCIDIDGTSPHLPNDEQTRACFEKGISTSLFLVLPSQFPPA